MTIPSHIGQYRIIRKIGAGGMGLVYLGEHTLLRRRAAIKTLLPTVATNREVVERFFNEARATSAISDPGVIQVFDFGYHVDGTAYIVMELLAGEALSTRIERLGRLALPDALRIARQIAGSLAVAHSHDIVHRDLKPENIFLVADAEAQGGERTKILDFGVCKVGSDDSQLTQSGAMIGTPVYMSPEQCRGARDVDHRSDIYACGCLLYHMLTGRPPFIAAATGELIVAHMHEEPAAPSVYEVSVPPAVDAVLLRCLAKAPGDRYQSMTELQLALSELYAQHDSVEPVAPTVAAAVPLGPGFRSVYDGNFAHGAQSARSAAGDSPVTRLPWQRLSPTSFVTSSPDELDDGDVRPRRSGLRAVLATALVAGVVIGLVATSFVVYGERDDGSGATREATTSSARQARQASPLAQHPFASPVESGGRSDDSSVAGSSAADRPRPAAAPATAAMAAAPAVTKTPTPAAPAATAAPATTAAPAATAARTAARAADRSADHLVVQVIDTPTATSITSPSNAPSVSSTATVIDAPAAGGGSPAHGASDDSGSALAAQPPASSDTAIDETTSGNSTTSDTSAASAASSKARAAPSAPADRSKLAPNEQATARGSRDSKKPAATQRSHAAPAPRPQGAAPEDLYDTR